MIPQLAGRPHTDLIERIRRSVIGDDVVLDGPVRSAPARVRRLHGLGSRAVVHRGLHPRARAAVVREHAHRGVRHRACTRRRCGKTPAASSTGAVGGSRRGRGAVLRFGLDRRDRHADPGARARAGAGGRWCSSAPTSTTRTSCRGASRSRRWSTIGEDADGRLDLDHLERELRRHADRHAEDRQLLGRFERDRHHHRRRPGLGACCAATARSRAGTTRRRDRTCRST